MVLNFILSTILCDVSIGYWFGLWTNVSINLKLLFTIKWTSYSVVSMLGVHVCGWAVSELH